MKEFTFFRELTGSTVVLLLDLTDIDGVLKHCKESRKLNRLGFVEISCRFLTIYGLYGRGIF